MPTRAGKTVDYLVVLRPDWSPRLMAWHDRGMNEPMMYGQTDCVLTCCDAICAQTDFDPGADMRGTYSTAAGALRIIREWGSLEAMFSAFLGPPLAHPLKAQRGDVGLFTEPVIFEGDAVDLERSAVVMGARIACRSDFGLTHRPVTALSVAWPVGRRP